jgi:hypothetical protein
LLRKKRFEVLPFYGDYIFPLRDYPVREILAVYSMSNEQEAMSNGELVEPEFYRVVPDGGDSEDIPRCLSVSPALRLIRGAPGLNAHYWAGYVSGKVPPDLASACLELAAWNMSRYRGPPPRSGFLIGMAGNIRGSGKDGEHLEASMPENVRGLLEPYKRRMI